MACLFAVALAEDSEVVKSYSEVNPEDFKYEIELTNHIKAVQEGHLQDKDDWTVKGEYEYISKEGKPVKVTYTADKHGYRPVVHV